MADRYLDNRPLNESTVSIGKNFGPWWTLVQANPVAGSTASSYGLTADQNDNPVVQHLQEEVFLLPDDAGRVTPVRRAGFIQNILSLPREKIKQYQIALKKAGKLPSNYVANGLPDDNGAFSGAILGIAQVVSGINFSKFQRAQDTNTVDSLGPVLGIDAYLKEQIAGGAGRQTTTSSRITTFDAAEARSVLEDFYAESIGRRPTDEEVAKFNAAINKAAKAKPAVTTTTTDAMGNSVSTGSDGFGQAEAQLMARNTAEATPGARGFLNSTKYMDAFMEAIQGKVGQ